MKHQSKTDFIMKMNGKWGGDRWLTALLLLTDQIMQQDHDSTPEEIPSDWSVFLNRRASVEERQDSLEKAVDALVDTEEFRTRTGIDSDWDIELGIENYSFYSINLSDKNHIRRGVVFLTTTDWEFLLRGNVDEDFRLQFLIPGVDLEGEFGVALVKMFQVPKEDRDTDVESWCGSLRVETEYESDWTVEE